ncbi:Efflux pump patC [Lachnellula suecica]|uniref:Efflux pump patC n=1 Tax=Lachnellula suecica TaxID=602035 RepID=A0A8T9CGT8_9HELO|nr:Efflux pump patC [Lachnellula suecica]
MDSTNIANEGVIPESQTHSGESIEELKHEPSSHPTASPEESLQTKEADSTRTVHGFKWFLVCASLYIACLIYGLDTTIAADIQAAIVEKFDSVERLTWVGTAFPLGSVCVILPLAGLYAVFDIKLLFISSILLFEVGSVVCGAAPTMDALIVGRVIAGIGGSGMYLGMLNYFSLCTSEKERGQYIGGIGVVWGIGAVLGPVVGGAFSTSSATWRWAFYINLVIAALCAPVYIFYLPGVKIPGAPEASILKRLGTVDWVGFVLTTGTVVGFTLVLTFAGSTWAWSDGRTIATFVVSGVVLVLTFLQQYFVLLTNREARMFPPKHILADRTLLLLNFITGAAGTTIYAPLYYIPIYFVFVNGDTALMAAVRLLPYIVFLALANILSGAFIAKINYYWALFLVGGIFLTIGNATMFTVNVNTPLANVYGYSIMAGVGTGLTYQVAYTVGPIKTMMKTGSGLDVQRVISMLQLSQFGVGMASLLVAGQIFQSLAVKNLSKVLAGMNFSEADIRGAIAGAQSTVFSSLSPDKKLQATAAITDAISRVYIVTIAGGALVIIFAMLLKKEKLFAAPPASFVGGGGA